MKSIMPSIISINYTRKTIAILSLKLAYESNISRNKIKRKLFSLGKYKIYILFTIQDNLILLSKTLIKSIDDYENIFDVSLFK